jgi:hypothetical protein
MKSIQKQISEADAQVVETIDGRSITRAELRAAFDRVADRSHWKNPIASSVVIHSEFEREVIRRAVVFFTGSVPTFEHVAGPFFICRAAGYFAAVGA